MAPSESNKEYCDECGGKGISTCQSCNASIKGRYSVRRPGIRQRLPYSLPHFCVNCGNPFPWTEAKLKAARELADEIGGLNEEERETLEKSLDDIVRDSPQTSVAAFKFKRLVSKTGKGAAEAFKDILVNVVVEAAKKTIWPGP